MTDPKHDRALVFRAKTLAELRELIADTEALSLSKAQRQRIAADLARVMKQIPAAAVIPPVFKDIEPLLRRFVAAHMAMGISEKRAENIASNVRRALALGKRRRRTAQDLSLEWREMKLLIGTSRFVGLALGRFINWCSDQGISPHIVADTDVTRFRALQEEDVGATRARKNAICLITAWNQMREATPSWPQTSLTSIPTAYVGTPEHAFAPTFLAELKRHRELMQALPVPSTGKKRRFDEESSVSEKHDPCGSRTASTRYYLLRSGAVRLSQYRGHDLTEIGCLADLLGRGAPSDILDSMDEDLHDDRQLRGMLSALRHLATTHVKVAPETMVKLDNLSRRIGKPDLQMTEDHRRLLREIGSEDLAALFDLPSQLMYEVEQRMKRLRRKAPLSYEIISLARAAVSMSILLYTPPRISNVAGIIIAAANPKDLEIVLFEGRSEGRIRFPANKMKGRRSWDCPLHERTIPVLRWYLAVIRPRLGGDPAFLFPGENGPVTAATLRKDLRNAMVGRVRIVFHPHFFRHLAAHVLLVDNPGKYELVQQLLAHHSVETTKAFYCGEETEAALRHVGQCMSAFVKGMEAPKRPRRKAATYFSSTAQHQLGLQSARAV